eukprot:EG_transcript_8926
MSRTARLLITLLVVSLTSSYVTYTIRLLRSQESRLTSLHAAVRRVEKHAEAGRTSLTLAGTQHQKSLAAVLDLLHGVDGRLQHTLRTVRSLGTEVSGLRKALADSALRQRFAEVYDIARLELAEQVRRLQQPASCRHARYLGCHIALRACGFTCQMHTLADCMTSALLSNRTAVVVPPELYVYGLECGSAWECFLQPLSSCNWYAENTTINDWHNWAMDSDHQFTMYYAWGEDPYRVPPALADRLEAAAFRNLTFVPTAPCLLTGVLLKWALRPNDRLQQVIQRRWQGLGLTSTLADVGMHVRRTDKVTENEARQYDLRYYMMHVDHFVGPTTYHHASYGRRYDKHVFVMTDSSIASEVELFPEYNFTVALPTEGRWDRESLDFFLADVLYLARLPYFIGTLSSQGSRLVAELRAAGPTGADSFRTMASLDAGYYKGVQDRQPWPTSLRLTPHSPGMGIIRVVRRRAIEVGHFAAPPAVITAGPTPSPLPLQRHRRPVLQTRPRKRPEAPAPAPALASAPAHSPIPSPAQSPPPPPAEP